MKIEKIFLEVWTIYLTTMSIQVAHSVSASTFKTDAAEIDFDLSNERWNVSSEPEKQPLVKDDNPVYSNPPFTLCSASSHCLGHSVPCGSRKSHCVCRQYWTESGSGICEECAYDGDPCDNCCSKIGVACINGICKRCITETGRSLCNDDAIIIVTISQIALSVALILGIIALLLLWYRMLITNYASTNLDSNVVCSHNYPRASLTSTQVRVLAKMQDRPPSYEPMDSYNLRLEQNREERHRIELVFSNEIRQNIGNYHMPTGDFAPPGYEDDVSLTNERPPPYTREINDTNQLATISTDVMNPTEGYASIDNRQLLEIKVIGTEYLINDVEKSLHI